jgi:hypothetical protein
MKRRIFGLESEYGITCTRPGRPVLTPEVLARYLFDEIAPSPRYPRVFLENGGLLYVDTVADQLDFPVDVLELGDRRRAQAHQLAQGLAHLGGLEERAHVRPRLLDQPCHAVESTIERSIE